MARSKVKLLDCTLRDGGYYNSWDFSPKLINKYLKAMAELPAQFIEFGFRNLPGESEKFLGGCAFSSDRYINSFNVPDKLKVAVMINGADLLKHQGNVSEAINELFKPAGQSPVDLVRLACHVHQVEETMPAIIRLKELGYDTTVNLMQIAGLSIEDIEALAIIASKYPIDVLYFADSLGSMAPDDVSNTVNALRNYWKGELGFHPHNNMELALLNTVMAMDEGVTWVDGSVLGMGRGPGNARTEYLAMEFESRFGLRMNHTPLLKLINKSFIPMQEQFGWGPNPFYYLAGKYGIHPTFIQEMLVDSRYDEEDVLAVIDNLRKVGGKKYKAETLAEARNFYTAEPQGSWNPSEVFENKDILVIGSGPGAAKHRYIIENYIRQVKPVVVALNIQAPVAQDLINLRTACHPVRLLADNTDHLSLPQNLILPYSMLPEHLQALYKEMQILDFGLGIREGTFEFHKNWSVIPNTLVLSYTLALLNSGKAKRILLAGFDGYGVEDPRTLEVNEMFEVYNSTNGALPLVSVTPTQYRIPQISIYDPGLWEAEA